MHTIDACAKHVMSIDNSPDYNIIMKDNIYKEKVKYHQKHSCEKEEPDELSDEAYHKKMFIMTLYEISGNRSKFIEQVYKLLYAKEPVEPHDRCYCMLDHDEMKIIADDFKFKSFLLDLTGNRYAYQTFSAFFIFATDFRNIERLMIKYKLVNDHIDPRALDKLEYTRKYL